MTNPVEDAYELPFTFLGLPGPEGGADGARVAILPIAYESTASYRGGTRLGPQAIIDASRYVETWDEERGWDLADLPMATLQGIAPLAGNSDAMMERIERYASEYIRPDRMLVTLGGEHSITGPLVRAHAARYPDLTVVQFDAHADLRDSYEGSASSHASAMRRVSEVARTIGIGVRAISREEVEWLESGQDRAEVIYAHQMRHDPDIAVRRLRELSGNVYVTIDLDALDPSIMPGTGTPEPGGLEWGELLRCLEALADQTEIVGADVVELSPIPGSVVSEFTAARIVQKLIAYRFDPGRNA